RTKYPLPEQEQEAKNKRRMGLGITGLANTGEALGYRYGSKKFLDFENKITETLRDHCYHASVELSIEKGSFPLYDREKYLNGDFIRTSPEDLRQDIYN